MLFSANLNRLSLVLRINRDLVHLILHCGP